MKKYLHFLNPEAGKAAQSCSGVALGGCGEATGWSCCVPPLGLSLLRLFPLFQFPQIHTLCSPKTTCHVLCILPLPQATTASLGAGVGIYSSCISRFSHCIWCLVGNCWIHSTLPGWVGYFILHLTFLSGTVPGPLHITISLFYWLCS